MWYRVLRLVTVPGPLLAEPVSPGAYPFENVVVQQLYWLGTMLENYIDVIEASKILDVHPRNSDAPDTRGQAHSH